MTTDRNDIDPARFAAACHAAALLGRIAVDQGLIPEFDPDGDP